MTISAAQAKRDRKALHKAIEKDLRAKARKKVLELKEAVRNAKKARKALPEVRLEGQRDYNGHERLRVVYVGRGDARGEMVDLMRKVCGTLHLAGKCLRPLKSGYGCCSRILGHEGECARSINEYFADEPKTGAGRIEAMRKAGIPA